MGSLHFDGGISVTSLKKKSKKLSKFLLKREITVKTVKITVYYERGVQLDKLFKQIIINTLNSHSFWRIRSTFVTKVGFLF